MKSFRYYDKAVLFLKWKLADLKQNSKVLLYWNIGRNILFSGIWRGQCGVPSFNHWPEKDAFIHREIPANPGPQFTPATAPAFRHVQSYAAAAHCAAIPGAKPIQACFCPKVPGQPDVLSGGHTAHDPVFWRPEWSGLFRIRTTQTNRRESVLTSFLEYP